ncbi:protein phosphatase methylesterase 1-like [Daphnia pulicaria]|uniref:protein phosphatase methylesterase 1-like n=1 Tax=Daphnia pulicaria TaxID=35523 RepID=UPI001EEB1C84|nr:protein phosphatase methylesterase 1-like [Daphnia pulicaria]
MEASALKKVRCKLIAPLGLPPPSSKSFSRPSGMGKKKDYTPIHWSRYFTSREKIVVNEDGDSFQVYRRGSSGPLLVLLHGGGFSALSWSLFAECIEGLVSCQILAIDMRGHGDSKTHNDENLSAETQADDIVSVVKHVFGSDPPPIVLIGHSMGGAIAVHAAATDQLPMIAGLIVIDVVEGTAMEALASMQNFLRSRPKQFLSLEQAIEWSVRSGQIRNGESARVSMPGQLRSDVTGECATSDVPETVTTPTASSPLDATTQTSNALKHGECITEDDEDEKIESSPSTREPTFFPPAVSPKTGYHWRIDLTKTEHQWPGWFHGLSATFLAIPVAKLLLLAGIDRLDRELTVGQMQGKFQMQVLPQCGHAVHEDVPDKVAEVVATFLVRNRLTSPKEKFNWVMPAC